MAAEVHAIPGAQFMDPAVLARIGNLELISRAVADGFINGLHRSPYLGLSLDFAEHRQYMPGDDIRRIDWRVYARTDRFYVKEYEADTNSNFMALLDVSKSMAYGSKGITKLDYLHLEQSAELIDLQRDLKRVFDPNELLNPGKIFAPRGHRDC